MSQPKQCSCRTISRSGKNAWVGIVAQKGASFRKQRSNSWRWGSVKYSKQLESTRSNAPRRLIGLNRKQLVMIAAVLETTRRRFHCTITEHPAMISSEVDRKEIIPRPLAKGRLSSVIEQDIGFRACKRVKRHQIRFSRRGYSPELKSAEQR